LSKYGASLVSITQPMPAGSEWEFRFCFDKRAGIICVYHKHVLCDAAPYDVYHNTKHPSWPDYGSWTEDMLYNPLPDFMVRGFNEKEWERGYAAYKATRRRILYDD
jgi:hypothetical protein